MADLNLHYRGPRIDRLKPVQSESDRLEQARYDALDRLKERATELSPIERFTIHKSSKLDFIECLLDTGTLELTNPRDYIYGIVGMTGYPAKPMSIIQWRKERQYETFVPIDYEADIVSILCATTWAMIMKGGLAVIAKFKAFRSNEKSDSPLQLPSWVIDWRLAAESWERVYHKQYMSELERICLHNAWYARKFTDCKRPDNWKRHSSVLYPTHSPEAQHQLCDDNRHEGVSPKNLLVRGFIDRRYYGKDKSVWEKRLFKDRKHWDLSCEISPNDIVVHLNAFVGPLSIFANQQGPKSVEKGLWLLRPTDNDEYKLVACLSGLTEKYSEWYDPFYDHWMWNPADDLPATSQQIRRLWVASNPYLAYDAIDKLPALDDLLYLPTAKDVTHLPSLKHIETEERVFTII